MTESLTPLPLQRVFTSKAVAKVLDFLLTYRDFDYSKTDISRESEVEWKNMYERVWPILTKYKLIKATRTVGRAQLYVTNMDNPIMQALVKVMSEIAAYDNQPLIEQYAKQKSKTEKRVAIPA